MNVDIIFQFLLVCLFTFAHGKSRGHEKNCTLILVPEALAELQIREYQFICMTEGSSFDGYPIIRTILRLRLRVLNEFMKSFEETPV